VLSFWDTDKPWELRNYYYIRFIKIRPAHFNHFLVPGSYHFTIRQDKLYINQRKTYFMLLISCTFLQSIYFPTNALHDTTYKAHIKTPTCISIQVPKHVRVFICAKYIVSQSASVGKYID
jgi:hypothetical protein